jgi:hypothetical protein
MAGYHDDISFDPSHEMQWDSQQQKYRNYFMNKKNFTREKLPTFASAQFNIDYFGPIQGKKVTQESLLQGRGKALSNDPSCEVTVLPASMFPNPGPFQPSCENVDLQPIQPRVKPSCNGIRETDIYVYSQMPGAWQSNGYLGYKLPVEGLDINLPTRLKPLINPYNLPRCATSYASYGNHYNLTPYS